MKKNFKQYMRKRKVTVKLAKNFRINIGRTLKSVKKFIIIRENLIMKEATALWLEHSGILYVHLPSPIHQSSGGQEGGSLHYWYWLLVAKKAILVSKNCSCLFQLLWWVPKESVQEPALFCYTQSSPKAEVTS